MILEESCEFVDQTLHYFNELINNFIVCHQNFSFHVTMTIFLFKDTPQCFANTSYYHKFTIIVLLDTKKMFSHHDAMANPPPARSRLHLEKASLWTLVCLVDMEAICSPECPPLSGLERKQTLSYQFNPILTGGGGSIWPPPARNPRLPRDRRRSRHAFSWLFSFKSCASFDTKFAKIGPSVARSRDVLYLHVGTKFAQNLHFA